MSVDVKKIKVGDAIVHQNGNMCTVTHITNWPVRHGQKEFTVVTHNETLEEHTVRARTHNEVGYIVVDGEPDGSFRQADEWDIVKHIPAKTSEEIKND